MKNLIFALATICLVLFGGCDKDPPDEPSPTHELEGIWKNKQGNTLLDFKNQKATFYFNGVPFFGDFHENTDARYLNYRFFNFYEISRQQVHQIQWYHTATSDVIYCASLPNIFGFRQNIFRVS